MSKRERVYLDYAATTPVRQEVLDVMLDIYKNEYGNPSSFYQEGQKAAKIVSNARDTVAACIGAQASEVYFTSCGTESDNWAIKGAAASLASKGKHIITSKIEHHAVIHPCEALAKQGYEITWIEVDQDGLVNPDDVRSAIRPDTILVTIMMANNEIGTVQPIGEIGKICKEKKVLFHTDAVQAAGALKIDVKDLNVDLMSFSGHKIYAPKGVGALYIRKGVRIANLLDGGAQEKNKRGGTENVAAIAGFAKAFELATTELEENSAKLSELRDSLMNQILAEIPYARINGHKSKRLPNNVNISFEFIEGESILLMLDFSGYSCSSGSACTSGSLDPSHVLLAIGLPHEIAHGSLRVTFGKDSRQEHVDNLVKDLKEIVKKLRDMSPLYSDFLKNGRN
ncbi:MAG: cysteine desulfurase NifS [Eubacteriales bacterium]|nr:cysteine desulfurase NifS [Eubacteriales bacterium]MDD3197343.1 cysteine desulfurase NifS [Eubacteriales bacterium]MDD3503696.1 cysteine desulfurase NifS [Eubacteriales bacterium]MDD4681628.1 cysteine desulfurase NifS [Eubacteriales bacterium]